MLFSHNYYNRAKGENEMLKKKSCNFKPCDFCTNCREISTYTLQKKIIKKKIKGKTYNFELTVAICEKCGEEMDIPGLLDLNMNAIDEQYKLQTRD